MDGLLIDVHEYRGTIFHAIPCRLPAAAHFSVPRKSMCSVKCARPGSSGGSIMDPTPTCGVGQA